MSADNFGNGASLDGPTGLLGRAGGGKPRATLTVRAEANTPPRENS